MPTDPRQATIRSTFSAVLAGGFFVATACAGDPPYPPSSLIKELRWAPVESIVRRADGSDNWPMTWGDDDRLYTAYGDGWGFEPRTKNKLSQGLAVIAGRPDEFQAENLRSKDFERTGQGARGAKTSGLLMVEGVLYAAVRNSSNAQLAWSRDRGASWTWAPWRFTTSFGCPTFLNFGPNYAGARDPFVYLYSADSDSAYTAADRMVLARVHRNQITDRNAYEFFVKCEPGQEPEWTTDVNGRGPVFKHPQRCYRSGITYHSGIKRYLWCQTLPESQHDQGPRFEGGFGIYEAPEPWGPWSTVFFIEHWDVGPGETNCFPSKWLGERDWHLVFSGNDAFSVRRATVHLAK